MKLGLFVIFFIFFTKFASANEYNFQKIVTLDKPWGSTFVNDNQILLTEVSGKIKRRKHYMHLTNHKVNILMKESVMVVHVLVAHLME